MASLLVRKGANPGQRVLLRNDTVVLGRSPDCDFSIFSPSVSRQHARLVRIEERWHIEDMLSRNGTDVNHVPIKARTPLKHNDTIRICDFEAVFHDSDSNAAVTTEEMPAVGTEPEDDLDDSSSMLATLAIRGSRVLDGLPAEQLRQIVDIGNRLFTTLELDQLLPKIAESMFQLFAQAERCFVILRDEPGDRLVQQEVRTRRLEDEAEARFSRSVVRQCIDGVQAFLGGDQPTDKRGVPRSDPILVLRSIMCTPFCTDDDHILGAIQLDTSDPGRRFTHHDLRLFVSLASQAGLALKNARLYQEMQKREQIERDLELAAQVQRSILPVRLPQLPGYEFFSHYSSALEVGGDYFDFIPLPRQRLAVTVGDVAGKSVPAAILMAKLSSDARTCLLTEEEPGAAIRRLNAMLYRYLCQTDRWITFAAAVIDPVSHTVTIVNAGHCTPLLYRHGSEQPKEAVGKEVAGVPLGVTDQPVYGVGKIKLKPGDSLICFTDGVPEALNARNEQFRAYGMYECLAGAGSLSPAQLGERMIKAVQQHAAGQTQHDDITLVTFGRIL
jgi:sigma-B regulation protein RsbU (phosphoserine phosphatase)